MIIDFTISNFRSIKSEQTFSFYAENPGSHLVSNIAFPGNGKVGVLRCAGIYGANASGKSNLLLAFAALQYLVCKTGDLKEGDQIPCYEPYLLSDDTKAAPVRFEIEFFTPDGTRYRYAISFTAKSVIEERLHFYPSAKSASVFSKKMNDDWSTIRFGTLYTGGKKRHPFFENNAYLSVAGNKADTPELVRNVYNYFRRDIFYLGIKEHVCVPAYLEGNTDSLKKISEFLSLVDTGITGIKQEERTDIEDIKFPKNMPKEVRETIIKPRSMCLHCVFLKIRKRLTY